MTRPSAPVGVYLTLVFVSGLLVGAFGMRLYIVKSVSARAAIPRPTADEFRRHLISEMQSRFRLRADQVTGVNQILDETRARFHDIHKKIGPEIKALRKEQNDRIRALLTPEQQPEYDRWRAERDNPGH